jgi:uncharacterized membrane protein (UPF0136 family)
MAERILSYTYSAALAVGGAVGFAKAGSVPSLVAGVVSGALFYALERVSLPNGGFVQAAGAAALCYVMRQRWEASGKFMPAGLVAGLSLVMTAVYAYRAFRK